MKERHADGLAAAGLLIMGALGCSGIRATPIANIGIPFICGVVATGLVGVGYLHFKR